MYNIADFLLVQLSLSRLTLIKSARSGRVWLSYISTAQFYQSYNHNININKQPMCTGQFFFRLIFDWSFLAAFLASRNFFGGFSADKNSAANPATDKGSSHALFYPWRQRLLNGPRMPSPSTKAWYYARTLLWLSQWVLNTPMHCACTW